MKKITSFILILIFVGSLTLQAQIRLTAVDPATGTVSIKNFGTVAVNLSSHRLCHLFTYPTISSLTLVSGSMSNLLPGASLVVTGVGLNATASDLGLYLPTGAFTDPNNMLDFVQWGSAGNGRESVAVSKGIWDVGTFITVAPPYQYTGDGLQQFGVTFWQTLTGISENEFSNTITVYPNPAQNIININTNTLSGVTFKVLNLLGEQLLIEKVSNINQNYQLDVSELITGKYILLIESEEGVAVKKITIVK